MCNNKVQNAAGSLHYCVLNLAKKKKPSANTKQLKIIFSEKQCHDLERHGSYMYEILRLPHIASDPVFVNFKVPGN
jgi:hypothetical protein